MSSEAKSEKNETHAKSFGTTIHAKSFGNKIYAGTESTSGCAEDKADERKAAALENIAEQLRIANLIALGQFRVGTNDLPPLRHLVVQPINEYDVGPTPDIAKALGLGADSE